MIAGLLMAFGWTVFFATTFPMWLAGPCFIVAGVGWLFEQPLSGRG